MEIVGDVTDRMSCDRDDGLHQKEHRIRGMSIEVVQLL
jgi:hypothetical protein